MRMEKGGPVVDSPQEVERNAQTLASSTETLIQDSPDAGPLMEKPSGSTVTRDLQSTATSRDPLTLEHPPTFPAVKEPHGPVHVEYALSGANSRSPPQSTSSEKPAAASSDGSAISELRPLAPEAYGGGIYGHDDSVSESPVSSGPASHSQSADGPPTGTPEPPVTGDRGLAITGQSYIQ